MDPAVAGEVGTNVLPVAENLVALAANPLEHLPAGDRVAS